MNLLGYCLFDDARGTSTSRSDSLAPVRVTTPLLDLVIEPVLHRR